jgi:hypothetical protein
MNLAGRYAGRVIAGRCPVADLPPLLIDYFDAADRTAGQ